MKTKNLPAVCITVCCLLSSAYSFSQGTWPWAKQNTSGNNLEEPGGVATDAAGNVYAVGHFFSAAITFGAVTLTNNAFGSFYIVKFDPSGNVLWAKNSSSAVSGSGSTMAYSVAVDAAGNIYAGGQYNAVPVIFGSITLPNAGSLDAFLVKYDASGNLLWAKSAGGMYEDRCMATAVDASGNVYITGYFQDVSITFGSNTLTHVGPAGFGESNLFFVKYDASGNVLWAKGAGSNNVLGNGLALSPSGNDVYLIGGFRGSVAFGATTLTSSMGAYDEGFIVRYDAAGNAVWAKQSVSYWKQAFQGVTVDLTGNFVYVGGLYHLTTITFGAFTLPDIGYQSGFIVRYDASSGNVLCAQNLSENNAGSDITVWGVATDASGDVYTAGRAFASVVNAGSFNLPTPASGMDPMFVMVFDQNCAAICGDALESGGNALQPLAANATGDVYVSGGLNISPTMTIGATTLTANGGYDVWVAKYEKCTTSALNVSASSTAILCNGQCAGTATATPTSGTSPYTYSWNTVPIQNTQTATGLCAGNYNVTVTDATGSTGTANVTIAQPTAITASTSATPASCGSNTGTATVAVAGGSGSYTYSWNPSSQTISTATGLSGGNYTITITDTKGCTQTATVTITQTGGPALTTSSTPQTCTQSGTASANASGGTAPYTYQWCNGQTTSSVTGLAAGNCTVIVTDASGCSTADTATITTSGSIPTATVTSSAASCGNNNGTATAAVSGGTAPYTYLWSNNSTTQQISNLSAGNYTVTVTDVIGCMQTAATNITSTPGPTAAVTATSISLSPGNSSQLTATGGGTYSWAPAAGLNCATCANPTATPSQTTAYCVFVTDAGGCSDSACITVYVELPCGNFYIPNAF
ncbi:MAG: hypothetical protein EPN85_04025, partial [Bacteroidetes bacterium]